MASRAIVLILVVHLNCCESPFSADEINSVVRGASAYRGNPPAHCVKHDLYLPPANSDGWGLPEVGDVASLTFNLYDNPLNPKTITGALVPSSDVSKVLEKFRGFQPESRPNFEMQEIGQLRFEHKSGAVTRLTYYVDLATPSLCFSLQGMRCFRASDPGKSDVNAAFELDLLLREIAAKETSIQKP